jgi:hypothetical protein
VGSQSAICAQSIPPKVAEKLGESQKNGSEHVGHLRARGEGSTARNLRPVVRRGGAIDGGVFEAGAAAGKNFAKSGGQGLACANRRY